MSNETRDTPVWILHRDPAQRRALARAAGVSPGATVASPTDPRLQNREPPAVVVLGLDGTLEVECDFIGRNSDRLARCSWVLVSRDHDPAALERRFDTVNAEIITAPYSNETLRERIQHARATNQPLDTLSLQAYRQRLSERFIRWFKDLIEIDELRLLQALNPSLATVPLLVRGEPGSGRELFARYVHTFGGESAGGGVPFVSIDCANLQTEDELLAAMQPAEGASAATLFLKRPEALAKTLRGRLTERIRYGPTPSMLPGTRTRWVAALPPESEGRPDHWLTRTLAGLAVSLPPLRTRSAAILPLADATIANWSEARGQRPRALSPEAAEALALYSWPGNTEEFESVLLRALALFPNDPIDVHHLSITGSHASDVGMLQRTEQHTAPDEDPSDVLQLTEQHTAPDEDPDDVLQLTEQHAMPEAPAHDERQSEWDRAMQWARSAWPGLREGRALGTATTEPAAASTSIECSDHREAIDGVLGELREANPAEFPPVIVKDLEHGLPLVGAGREQLWAVLSPLLTGAITPQPGAPGPVRIVSRLAPGEPTVRPQLEVFVSHPLAANQPDTARAALEEQRRECRVLANAAGGDLEWGAVTNGAITLRLNLPVAT